MHFRNPHLADKNRGKSGQDDYSDRMVTHDEQVRELLRQALMKLGIADNTIVMLFHRPTTAPRTDDLGRMAPTRRFRGQKDTNWEGGCAFRH